MLSTVKPRNHVQKETLEQWLGTSQNLLLQGSAGTGKTFLALYCALKTVWEDRDLSKVLLIRSAVPTRDIGFLPGDLEDKTNVYLEAYLPILHQLLPNSQYPSEYIEFMTTSYIRGKTFDNAVVIVDEAQNMSFHELDSVITRMGTNSRLIIIGDSAQCDLPRGSGLPLFTRILSQMKEFTVITFHPGDIVRSGLVRNYIKTKEQINAD